MSLFCLDKSLSSNDDVPDSLVLQCVRLIVKENLPFCHLKLPSEICHILLRVYREEYLYQQVLKHQNLSNKFKSGSNQNVLLENRNAMENFSRRLTLCPFSSLEKKSNSIGRDQNICEEFLSNFLSENMHLSHVDFSSLPINDTFLEKFLMRYRKSLVHLNVSNCTLSEVTLNNINRILAPNNFTTQMNCNCPCTCPSSSFSSQKFDLESTNQLINMSNIKNYVIKSDLAKKSNIKNLKSPTMTSLQNDDNNEILECNCNNSVIISSSLQSHLSRSDSSIVPTTSASNTSSTTTVSVETTPIRRPILLCRRNAPASTLTSKLNNVLQADKKVHNENCDFIQGENSMSTNINSNSDDRFDRDNSSGSCDNNNATKQHRESCPKRPRRFQSLDQSHFHNGTDHNTDNDNNKNQDDNSIDPLNGLSTTTCTTIRDAGFSVSDCSETTPPSLNVESSKSQTNNEQSSISKRPIRLCRRNVPPPTTNLRNNHGKISNNLNLDNENLNQNSKNNEKIVDSKSPDIDETHCKSCPKFTDKFRVYYQQHSNNCPIMQNVSPPPLKTLILGDNLGIWINNTRLSTIYQTKSESFRKVFNDSFELKKLVIHDCMRPIDNETDELSMYMKNENNLGVDHVLTESMLTTLHYLDLSGCFVGRCNALVKLQQLHTLILYNSLLFRPACFENIAKLTTLKVLDISQESSQSSAAALGSASYLSLYDRRHRRDSRDDRNPELQTNLTYQSLRMLVESLTNLTSFDISGNHLIATKLFDNQGQSTSANASQNSNRKENTLPNCFESRQNKQLDFLGIFHTNTSSTNNNNSAFLNYFVSDNNNENLLPAINIAGDANEAQVLTACEAYMHRKDQLIPALNALFSFFRIRDTFDGISRALDVVLNAMDIHIHNLSIQRCTTASLFYIVRSNHSLGDQFQPHIKRLIIRRLLDTMFYHSDDKMVLRNGILIMVNTHMFYLLFEYYRITQITMKIIPDNFEDQGFMQRMAVFLLNSISCQVGGEQKQIIGTIGVVESLIDLIKSRLNPDRYDITLETAWSTMWNITDETPMNCERFLKYDGLETFIRCMDSFPQSPDLLRNMMGLLGNVAECEHLRSSFMDERILTRFSNLLSSKIDGIECSYNACGILAHIMSDGPEFWNKHLSNESRISREALLDQMRQEISLWPINIERHINYRSFVPIVRLLKPNIAPEAQYWAVWALTNLTRVYPHKYCMCLINDGGDVSLQRLIDEPDTADYVKNLANITLLQVNRFVTEKSLCGLEECDSVDYETVVNYRRLSSTPNSASNIAF